MHHNKYEFIKTLIEANQPVLLQGPAGTGKTTIIMEVAAELGLEFASIPITKQTSKGDLLGFISITGEYIPTQFRKAVEFGHLFLLDEIDAGDSNTLLALNSLENGYVGFPDKVVKVHPNFRLAATANPINEHASYTGRSKLDYSTMDRFLPIQVSLDPELELALTCQSTVDLITMVRLFLKENNQSIEATMRDSIRVHNLLKLGIPSIDPIKTVVLIKDPELESLYDVFRETAAAKLEAERRKLEAERIKAAEEARKAAMTQEEVSTFSEFIEKIQQGK